MASMAALWTIFDSITPFRAALATSLLLLFLVYLFIKDSASPPGPIGLPFFGYYPFLNANTCHLQLNDMVGRYGDVYSFRSFGKLFIHLGSTKAIKEAQVTKADCFAGRYTDYGFLTMLFEGGVVLVNGDRWKVLRKFFLRKFKEFGMTTLKENTSGVIEDALKELVGELQDAKGQPIPMTDLVTDKCLAIIHPILFNNQVVTTEETIELKKEFEVLMGSMTSNMLMLFGKFVKYIFFPLKPQFREMKRRQARIDSILMNIVQKHKQAYDGSQPSQDVMDSFLKEREDLTERGDPTAEYFTDLAIASSLSQFFVDGVLTVGLLMGVFLLKLVELPEEQEKIFEEIVDVVGHERLPTMEDKSKLPYTNAFIYEVVRLSDFFPLFPSLECSKETEVLGHKIPKGAITFLNFYAANRNPSSYEDPETFNPSRYLSSSEKKADLPILFGVGRRSCIGEGFTTIQMFLFLTTIVKMFRLEVPESEKGASISFWNPEKVLIRAIPRSQQ